MEFVRLPLEGAKNTRDLGGYPTMDKKVTKFGVFVRSNRLTSLTEKDNKFLKEYGVTDIIDLRGKTDIQDNYISDDNINKDYFNFHYIPLNNTQVENYIEENLEEDDFNFGIGYSLILENKKRIKEIFDILVHSKGAVLFHCTSGKDRTGIISALILGLCKVKDEDIISNYITTAVYVADDEATLKYPPRMRMSDKSYIEMFLKLLRKNYTSFEEYILSIGVTQEEIQMLKDKFCENY